MICACQKQDSAADAQLAQRKTELDARENALNEKEKALSEREKAIARFRAIPSDLQSRKPVVDPEQAKNRIRQLKRNLLNGKQNWTHARRHLMKERKH